MVSPACRHLRLLRPGYWLKTRGGPTRVALKSMVTSTRSAMVMNLMPPPSPKSLRSIVSIPLISPVAPLHLDQR